MLVPTQPPNQRAKSNQHNQEGTAGDGQVVVKPHRQRRSLWTICPSTDQAKRVYMPESHWGSNDCWVTPVMRDRALQAMVKGSPGDEWEARFEETNKGSPRPSPQDAASRYSASLMVKTDGTRR